MHLVSTDTDCALFGVLTSSSSPAARQRAQTRLYERHGGYLLGILKGRSKRLLELAGLSPEDLLHETFFRAFDRADSYRCLEGSEQGSELGAEERRRTRAWLGRIAQRLLADHLAARQEVSEAPNMAEIADPGPASSGSQGALLVRQALGTLTEREQDILRVTALYYRVGQRHQRLPNEAARELAQRWKVGADNVRAIRKRALAKVRAYVEANSGKQCSAHPTSQETPS